jgi:hypothetical protein
MNISKLSKILLDISVELTENIEDSKSYLIEQGIDPDTVARNGINKLKQFQLKQQAILNEKNDKRLYELALIKIKEKANTFGNATNDLLNILLQKRPSFQFRNVESLTEDDLKEIINEVELIELMEKLDKKE